jgi:hypothetical protein
VNRRHHALLAPLLAVLALLLGLAGSASAAFNAAATDPHYGNFLLHTEAPARIPLAIADPAREIGVWLYDSTLGVPVYVRQNPWTSFDPHGLSADEKFRLPQEGKWSGERGNSYLQSHPKIDPKLAPNGIKFVNGTPDYSELGVQTHNLPESARGMSRDSHKRILEAEMQNKFPGWKIPSDHVVHHVELEGKVQLQVVPEKLHTPLAHNGPMAGSNPAQVGPNTLGIKNAARAAAEAIKGKVPSGGRLRMTGPSGGKLFGVMAILDAVPFVIQSASDVMEATQKSGNGQGFFDNMMDVGKQQYEADRRRNLGLPELKGS